MSDSGFPTFDALLDRSLDDPAAAGELESRFGRTVTTLVVDFTGMVHRTNHYGIVHALALSRRAEQVMRPAVEAHGGEIVKRVADSWFAMFRTPGAALAGILDGLVALSDFNRTRTGTLHDGSRNEPIHACAGLGHGPALVIPGRDLYGEEVNRAFVLGEDTAGPSEVLATDAFLAALGSPPAGVGVHRAPGDRIAAVGFPFHVLADYR